MLQPASHPVGCG